ncbi:MAG: chorismate-binding protein, partial [Acidobacteria bacterium]|nr:chorismate-binding protein [Acidobacteriota bacterium]
IETEALAGSIGSGDRQAARLLASHKDLGEHALVVEHLVERLRPFCDTLDWSTQPRIRELRNLLHLHTPIRGRLHRDTHILDLVAALHPTPAVAGVPAEAAVRWIAQRESTPRGWYAGPVGWFDAAGDGEFDVALRSCLLAGPTVWLFAGAGIMLDSDPEAEYQETALKQRSLLAALGVGE